MQTETAKVEYLLPCQTLVEHMLKNGEMQVVGKKIVLAPIVEQKVKAEYTTFSRKYSDTEQEVIDDTTGENWNWYYNTKWFKLGIKKVYSRMEKIANGTITDYEYFNT